MESTSLTGPANGSEDTPVSMQVRTGQPPGGVEMGVEKFEPLTAEEIWNVVNYLKSLGGSR